MSSVDPNRPDIQAFMARASKALNRNLPTPKDIFNFWRRQLSCHRRTPHPSPRRQENAITSWPIPNPLHWGVGDLSVILNGKGEPAAVMHTISFVECQFKDVAEDFALAEVEGDYEAYRRGHIWFYGQQQAENGLEFGDESMVLCERFVVIYPEKKD